MDKMRKSKKLVLDSVKKHPLGIGSTDIAKIIGMTARGVRYHLSALKKMGLISENSAVMNDPTKVYFYDGGANMGCDIHCILQKRTKGVWHTVCAISDIERNYTLFGILAGVRCDEYQPIDAPRGIPKGVDHVIKPTRAGDECRVYFGDYDYWLGTHSYSWLTIREILKYYAKNWCNEEIRLSLNYLLNILAERITKKGVYRIVFGFDS
jgi:DNA-binding transcriptional ArsR family regulator